MNKPLDIDFGRFWVRSTRTSKEGEPVDVTVLDEKEFLSVFGQEALSAIRDYRQFSAGERTSEYDRRVQEATQRLDALGINPLDVIKGRGNARTEDL